MKDKLFDERLYLHEDSELWRSLLRRGSFFAGQLFKAVSVVRDHEKKRKNTRTGDSSLKMYAAFFENVEIKKMYNFEKAYHIKEILRIQSKSFSSNWKRRLFFYSCLVKYKFNSGAFLKRYHANYFSIVVKMLFLLLFLSF